MQRRYVPPRRAHHCPRSVVGGVGTHLAQPTISTRIQVVPCTAVLYYCSSVLCCRMQPKNVFPSVFRSVFDLFFPTKTDNIIIRVYLSVVKIRPKPKTDSGFICRFVWSLPRTPILPPYITCLETPNTTTETDRKLYENKIPIKRTKPFSEPVHNTQL